MDPSTLQEEGLVPLKGSIRGLLKGSIGFRDGALGLGVQDVFRVWALRFRV